MTLDEIRDRLKMFNLRKVSDATGISHPTVWRIASGATKRPSWEVIDRLRAFIEDGK